jgi:hypothetical protein
MTARKEKAMSTTAAKTKKASGEGAKPEEAGAAAMAAALDLQSGGIHLPLVTRLQDTVVTELARRISYGIEISQFIPDYSDFAGGCRGCDGSCKGTCAGCTGDCMGSCRGDCSGDWGLTDEALKQPSVMARYLTDAMSAVISAYRRVLLTHGFPR